MQAKYRPWLIEGNPVLDGTVFMGKSIGRCFFDHNVNAPQDNSTNVKFLALVHHPQYERSLNSSCSHDEY